MSTSRANARALVVMTLAAAMAGCNMLSALMPGQKKSAVETDKLQFLQLEVMRYADEYVGRLVDPIGAFQREATLTEDRLAAQNWLVSQTDAAYTIASGSNPIANALDLVVLATLSRMVMEDSWVSEKYGARAEPLREAHVRLEPRAWQLVEEVLTESQRARLKEVIEDWRARNPHVRAVAYIHFHDFARATGSPRPGEAQAPGNLFAVLGLDPLSNLDPAVREITQTRHLAERAIYYMQRAPRLLELQVERLTYELAGMPEAKQLLADVERASLASEAAGKLAADLPAVIARERQAAIAQFTQALYDQESQMRELAVALQGTLEAGTATSNSLDATIRSLDSLMARFDKSSANAAPEPAVPAKPFDIADYAAAAREFSATARELQALVQAIDAGTPGLAGLAERTTDELNGVIDHLFWRLVLLGVIIVIACVAGTVVYRLIARRIGSQPAR